jgi:hypothetical protein
MICWIVHQGLGFISFYSYIMGAKLNRNCLFLGEKGAPKDVENAKYDVKGHQGIQ